jgi:hypothetical protein
MKKELHNTMNGQLGKGIRLDDRFGKFPIYEFASKDEDLKKLKNELMEGLECLRMDNGVFLASCGKFYLKSWFRDNFYANLAYLDQPEKYKQTMQTTLDYLIKLEDQYEKLSWLIKSPEIKHGEEWRFIRARFTKHLTEIPEQWGDYQVDILPEVLYGLYLGKIHNIEIVRNDRDREIIQMLVDILEAIECYKAEDNSLWEEQRKLCSASVGSCLAGLSCAKLMGYRVNQELLDNIHYALNDLLPNESPNRDCDLAQLSLIYPFFILDTDRANQILNNIENKLATKHGSARYKGDYYYNIANKDQAEVEGWYYDEDINILEGNEATWSMYLSFASLAHNILGNKEKAIEYAYRMIEETVIHNIEMPVINKHTGDYELDENGNKTYIVVKSAIPELFYAHTDIPNNNILLAWSQSLAVTVLRDVLGIK